MKLEKLLCLKREGRMSLANSDGCQITKEVPSEFHEMISLVAGSSTSMCVFNKNGGVEDLLVQPSSPLSLSPSMFTTYNKYYAVVEGK